MRIVVKVGTSTLAHPSGLINIRRVEELCKVMSDLKNAGHDIILVTSGAIGMGAGKLQLSERPRDVAANSPLTAREDMRVLQQRTRLSQDSLRSLMTLKNTHLLKRDFSRRLRQCLRPLRLTLLHSA